MSENVEPILEWCREYYEMLKNWKYWVKKAKEITVKLLSDAKVYVFGSVVTGKFTGASDIDVLIVSKHAPKSIREKVRLKIRIENELKLNFPKPNPLELHIVSPKEAEWYFKALRIKYVEV